MFLFFKKLNQKYVVNYINIKLEKNKILKKLVYFN